MVQLVRSNIFIYTLGMTMLGQDRQTKGCCINNPFIFKELFNFLHTRRQLEYWFIFNINPGLAVRYLYDIEQKCSLEQSEVVRHWHLFWNRQLSSMLGSCLFMGIEAYFGAGWRRSARPRKLTIHSPHGANVLCPFMLSSQYIPQQNNWETKEL